MPDLLPSAGGAVKNAAFELLHPRARKGSRNAGEFVDVVARMKGLGGRWDEGKGTWTMPSSRRGELDKLLDEVGFHAIKVPEGMHLASDEERAAAKVPPAWTDVFLPDTPDAKYRVIGTDAKGRPQRVRTARFEAQQDAAKYERTRALDAKLPAVDAHLSENAGHDDHAAALMLMRKMGLRPGSNADTKGDVQAYGATTLERRHVSVTGNTVRLKFVGKDGVNLDLKHEDPELARVLKKRLAGKSGDERIFKTNANRTNRLLETLAPGHTNKDLRTHLGTSIAAATVANMEPPTTDKEFRAARNKVGDAVSAVLGNKRQQALTSYIDPEVFGSWDLDKPGKPPEKIDFDEPAAIRAAGEELARKAHVRNKDEARANRDAFRLQSPVHEEVAWLAEHWTGAGGASDHGEDIRERVRGGGLSQAVNAMRQGQRSPTLYRGIRAWDEDSEAKFANIGVGDEIDLEGVSSFTENESHSRNFATPGFTTVTVEVTDARGLPVAGISNSPGEQEWLLTGKAHVTEVVNRRTEEEDDLVFTHSHVRVRWDPGDDTVPDEPAQAVQDVQADMDFPEFDDVAAIKGLNDTQLRAMISKLESSKETSSDIQALLETLWEEEDART